jgi:hypothetical protein
MLTSPVDASRWKIAKLVGKTTTLWRKNEGQTTIRGRSMPGTAPARIFQNEYCGKL